MKSRRKEKVVENIPDTEGEILKVDGAVRVCNVSRRTFERMKALGQLPYMRCGGGRVLRYRKSDLLAAMSALTVR